MFDSTSFLFFSTYNFFDMKCSCRARITSSSDSFKIPFLDVFDSAANRFVAAAAAAAADFTTYGAAIIIIALRTCWTVTRRAFWACCGPSFRCFRFGR